MIISDPSLESFATKFKSWRGNRKFVRYPDNFWDEIRQFSQKFPIPNIAIALGINPSYLKWKLKYFQQKLKNPKTLPFAPIQVFSLPSPISIEFLDQNGRPITIRFQADTGFLTQLIKSLSENKT